MGEVMSGNKAPFDEFAGCLALLVTGGLAGLILGAVGIGVGVTKVHKDQQRRKLRDRQAWLGGEDLTRITNQYRALEQSQQKKIADILALIAEQQPTLDDLVDRGDMHLAPEYRKNIEALKRVLAIVREQLGITWKTRVIHEMYQGPIVVTRSTPKKGEMPAPDSRNPDAYVKLEHQLRSAIVRLREVLEENDRLVKILAPEEVVGARELIRDVEKARLEIKTHFTAHAQELEHLADKVRFLAQRSKTQAIIGAVEKTSPEASLSDEILAVDRMLDELDDISDWTDRAMATAEVDLDTIETAYSALKGRGGINVDAEVRTAAEIGSLLRDLRARERA